MTTRLGGFWYALQHPLGPSRELDSHADRQKSVEKFIREMRTEENPDVEPVGTLAGMTAPFAK
ncbi:hypothetical protein [Mycolicibacterium confluentis]|uniref:Uncharacterized protein n=1 Tax=Mycolicibacterium confluentis TaxID=28047 RepID=A0A7I7Y0K3_9MYCO|nr:hypothetical protein [Mycolicibacterium confluentis]MCV7319618.1 hypothetical protein [Mycolicibacterium confluentis]ORV34224.1 hypothetical protein AWB99_00870 [Mycolicibacterium confluentis]BBZ34641.1 hypothetical protein MCNF_32460 [Mycolicibacterium confluentis]